MAMTVADVGADDGVKALVLAEGTVENRVSARLRKLGARDCTALVLTLYKARRNEN